MLVEYLKSLYDLELYEDVKLLASSFFSSQSFKEDPTFTTRYQISCIHADAHFQTNDYHSAIKYYKSALQTRSLVKGRGRKGGELRLEADVKYQQYQCYTRLKLFKEALAVLESIPVKLMTIPMKLALAELIMKMKGDKALALSLYKEVLRQQPLSFTAVKGYLSLGGKEDEVLRALEGQLGNQPELLEWMGIWVKGQSMAVVDGEYAKGADTLHDMSTNRFSVNTLVMSQAAYMYLTAGDYEKAMELFKWIRENNSLQYNHLDSYAFLLYYSCPESPVLESLATKSHLFPETVVEGWVITGYYNLSFHKANKAFFFAQKALQLDPQNFEALLLAGISLINQSDHAQALVHLRSAIQASPHRIEPYYFVTEVYWKTDRNSEARAVAFDYQQNYPSSRSYMLHASILIKEKTFNYDTHHQAQMLLRKALYLDPENSSAVELLARVIQTLNGNEEAIEFLKEHAPKKQDARYHKLLASIYFKIKGKKVNALDHLIIAKRLEPVSGTRKTGTLLFFFQDDSIDDEMDQLATRNKIEEIFSNETNDFTPLA